MSAAPTTTAVAPPRACSNCVAAFSGVMTADGLMQRDGGSYWQCRARPPVVVAHQDGPLETVWPRVRINDWCMGHKPA